MGVFKNGRFWWYEFRYDGTRYRKSTRQRNERAAIEIESARRTELARGESNLIPDPPASKPEVPTLREFEQRFLAWVKGDRNNIRTRAFYATAYTRLLEFKPFAGARLDQIDEATVELFKTKMLTTVTRSGKPPSKATINRYLCTLRKALRYASRNLRLFDRLPVITIKVSDERQREFIFNDDDYQHWLNLAPEPLRSASVLARECGICRGEMLALQRDCITLNQEPNDKGLYGYVDVRRGLKRKERRRKLPITAQMRDVIVPLLEQSQCQYVFTSRTNAAQSLSPWTLEDQLGRTRKALGLDADAGIHTLRHTFLTEKGRTTDAFTLQRIAGHANISTTMRYVHVQQAAIEDAFASRRENIPLKFPLLSKRKKLVLA
jgi:integrase